LAVTYDALCFRVDSMKELMHSNRHLTSRRVSLPTPFPFIATLVTH
jgi:hypothetical protein